MPITGMPRVASTLHDSPTTWQFGPFQLLVMAAGVVATVWYKPAGWKLAQRGGSWRGGRTWAYVVGLAAMVSRPLTARALCRGAMHVLVVTPTIGFAMAHMALTDLTSVGFLFGATLLWWPTIGIDPVMRWRTGYDAKTLSHLIGVPVEKRLGIALTDRDERTLAVRADAALVEKQAAFACMLDSGSLGGVDSLASRWEASIRPPVDPPWHVPAPARGSGGRAAQAAEAPGLFGW